MDSVSQAVLGASLGGAVLGKHMGRGALLAGALLGTLPDLDALLDYGDAVSNFTQHRGFSHSILVLVPFALLLAAALQRWRPAISYARWATFCSLALVTHPLLDAFTTYGTQLLWPFHEPVGLDSMFIIDPLYTLPLLAGCGVAFWRPRAVRPLLAGLVLSTVYLGWSLLGQQLITQRIMPTLAEYGVADAPRLVQPMPFSTVLWRVTVMGAEERLELVTGFLDAEATPEVTVYPRNVTLAQEAAELPAAEQLLAFTDGFLSFRIVDDLLTATDIRLGVPGAYPFTFVLAKQDGGRWSPTSTLLLPRPKIRPDALYALWLRTLGATAEGAGIEAAPRP